MQNAAIHPSKWGQNEIYGMPTHTLLESQRSPLSIDVWVDRAREADVICSLGFPWPAEKGEIRNDNTLDTPRPAHSSTVKILILILCFQ